MTNLYQIAADLMFGEHGIESGRLGDFDGISRTGPELILPHPRAQERAFVLAPWADVEPDATLPGYGPIRELLPALADQQVTRTELELS